jgi:hypothetical protein
MTVNPKSVFAPYDHSDEVTSHPAKTALNAPGSIQSQLNDLERRVSALEDDDQHPDGSGNNREPGPNAESLGRGAASGGANY